MLLHFLFLSKSSAKSLQKNYRSVVEAERNINRLIGNPVTVYFNPKKPKIACLENTFTNEIFQPIFMGLIFGGGLTYLSYYLLKIIIE